MSKTVTRFKKATASSALVLVAGTSLGLTPANANDLAAGQAATAIVQNAAAAVEAQQVTPTKISFTDPNNTEDHNINSVSWNANFDFSGQDLRAGDYFDLNFRVADGGTFENPTLWGSADRQTIATYTNENTDENKRAVLVGKNVMLDAKGSWNTSHEFPSTITRPDGSVIATVKQTWQGLRVTFTDAVEGRSNVTGSFDFKTTYTPDAQGQVDMGTSFPEYNQAGHAQTIELSEDEMRALPSAAPYYGIKPTKLLPAGIYVNGQYADSTTINPSVGGYIKQDRTFWQGTGNEVHRQSSDQSAENGSLRVGYAGNHYASAADVGNRQIVTFKVSPDTTDYLKFSFENWENGVAGVAKAIRLPNGQLVNAKDSELEQLKGPQLVNAPLSELASSNPYQIKVESYDNATGTFVFSWVPMDEGDNLRLQFNDGSVVKATSKALAEQKTTGYNFTTTYTHTGAESQTAGSASSWFFRSGEAEGLLSPVANPEDSTTEANVPVSYKLISNDTFPESSYGATTITGQPSNGTVTIGVDGTATYTPNPGFVGTDVVTYKNTNAKGSESNETTWTIKVVAPAAPVAKDDALEIGYSGHGAVDLTVNDTANGQGNRIAPNTVSFLDGAKSQTIDDIKFTIGQDGKLTADATESNHAGTYTLEYKVADIYGTETTAKVKVVIKEPTIQVGIKTLIAGQDANDPNSPVILAPGEHEVIYQIDNPNIYPLDTASLVLSNGSTAVDLPEGLVIPAGGVSEVKSKVSVPKQGKVDVAGKVNASYSYALDGKAKTITATAQDPAYAKALTGKITTNPDKIRVKVGESFTLPILPNDATDPAGHPLVPATVKLTGFADNGDGTFTHEASGVKVQYDGKGNITGVAGEVEGLVKDLHYTVESTLGDVSELTLAEIEVYAHHVTLKAEIDGNDANTIEDAYKITIPHNQDSIDKRILLPFTNPGTDPITVTGFKDQDGNTYTLDEPVTLAGGEAGEFYADYRFTPGTHELNFEIITEEGVTAMDPVVVVVEQEEAPAPEPTQEPKVEQQKPAEPVVQEKPKPIVPETGAGYSVQAGEGVELVASGDAASAPASSGLLGLLGGLVGGVLGALGFQAYNRKKN